LSPTVGSFQVGDDELPPARAPEPRRVIGPTNSIPSAIGQPRTPSPARSPVRPLRRSTPLVDSSIKWYLPVVVLISLARPVLPSLTGTKSVPARRGSFSSSTWPSRVDCTSADPARVFGLQVCPFLVRVFVNFGSNHSTSEFGIERVPKHDEYELYTW